MPKEALLQQVEWRSADILHSALKLIGHGIEYLAPLGTAGWSGVAITQLLPSILVDRNISRHFFGPIQFPAIGFTLIFFGPNRPPVERVYEGVSIYRHSEPKFIFSDHSYQVLPPRVRTAFYSLCEEIGREMSEVYKLRLSRNPLSLTFPLTEYAKIEGLVRAAML